MERSLTLPRTPSFRLDGKRALVTGGSRGIGLGCSVALAEQGAAVTVAARSAGEVEAAVDALRAEGWTADGLILDMTDIGALTTAFATPFDVVVNSAGLARHSPATETTEADFDAVMNVNVRAAYFLSQQAAKALIAAGKTGSIIHISSQMGHTGGVDRAVYCASKHAVEGMVKSMAQEFGPHNIRINTVCPTFIRTPLTETTFSNPERVAWIRSKIKLDRFGEVEDIMGAVAFLASDASAMVTGTALMVDGGWTTG
ncbi:2-deoxy-D-gluconate 3-dehydrogenase [Rubricella aquisinus]|uniref:2-deoxy-D-gluconate 3-dehydrogenase n=1 Tax=Rubricella aquisinus TaxID=2028108 RepID=A0A840WU02_9RHOB|nr:SDR family oxidoreductase [Rubricella aquisinus]MBB5514690.1 2-deoxy-D-gluconate 3-dehydrogenase [Rubricella aquisinus]